MGLLELCGASTYSGRVKCKGSALTLCQLPGHYACQLDVFLGGFEASSKRQGQDDVVVLKVRQLRGRPPRNSCQRGCGSRSTKSLEL